MTGPSRHAPHPVPGNSAPARSATAPVQPEGNQPMVDLVLRPSTPSPGRPWSLQLRYHECYAAQPNTTRSPDCGTTKRARPCAPVRPSGCSAIPISAGTIQRPPQRSSEAAEAADASGRRAAQGSSRAPIGALARRGEGLLEAATTAGETPMRTTGEEVPWTDNTVARLRPLWAEGHSTPKSAGARHLKERRRRQGASPRPVGSAITD